MTKQRLSLALFLAILLTGQVLGQDYNLGWDEINRTPKNQQSYTLNWSALDRHVDRAEPQPVIVAEPPVIANVQPPTPQVQASAPRRRVSKPVPTYDISLSASRFYDHYEERYKVVRAIEVATFRAGSLNCETFENIGECSQYEIFLNDLKPGDRYQARIIWDDGSNRTIDKTIGRYVDRQIFVDQPDFLAYSAW